MCAQAPSGECLRGYKPRVVDCIRLAPRVEASCLAKPSCYTWHACRYLLCCPAWQLVDRVLASAFDICVIKNYFTLLYFGQLSITKCRTTVLITSAKEVILPDFCSSSIAKISQISATSWSVAFACPSVPALQVTIHKQSSPNGPLCSIRGVCHTGPWAHFTCA